MSLDLNKTQYYTIELYDKCGESIPLNSSEIVLYLSEEIARAKFKEVVHLCDSDCNVWEVCIMSHIGDNSSIVVGHIYNRYLYLNGFKSWSETLFLVTKCVVCEGFGIHLPPQELSRECSHLTTEFENTFKGVAWVEKEREEGVFQFLKDKGL